MKVIVGAGRSYSPYQSNNTLNDGLILVDSEAKYHPDITFDFTNEDTSALEKIREYEITNVIFEQLPFYVINEQSFKNAFNLLTDEGTLSMNVPFRIFGFDFNRWGDVTFIPGNYSNYEELPREWRHDCTIHNGSRCLRYFIPVPTQDNFDNTSVNSEKTASENSAEQQIIIEKTNAIYVDINVTKVFENTDSKNIEDNKNNTYTFKTIQALSTFGMNTAFIGHVASQWFTNVMKIDLSKLVVRTGTPTNYEYSQFWKKHTPPADYGCVILVNKNSTL